MSQIELSLVEEIILEAKEGKVFIITDDETRENEGDLVFAGDFVTSQKINFLITHARGLVCVPISSQIAQRINLPLMLKNNTNNSKFGTNFTLSVGASSLKGTGISASDRAITVKTIADKNSTENDF